MRASYIVLQNRKLKTIQVNHHMMAGLVPGTCHGLCNAVENYWAFPGSKGESGVTNSEGLFFGDK